MKFEYAMMSQIMPQGFPPFYKKENPKFKPDLFHI